MKGCGDGDKEGYRRNEKGAESEESGGCGEEKNPKAR